MPVIDDFEGLPKSPEASTEFVMEDDLLTQPNLPWSAIMASFFAVVLCFCIAHAILLATKEKNRLISKTVALKEERNRAATLMPPVAAGDEDVVLIPAGKFWMGRELDDPETNADTMPLHQRAVGAFYIGRYEVTNAQYEQFVQATGYIPPPHWKGESHAPQGIGQLPVTYINSVQAADYAEWRGGRLCSEPEWEKAARGSDDTRVYPYGDDYDPLRANTDYELDRLTPVGSYDNGVSPYGVHDLMGNVYEWTASHYAPYPGNQDDPVQYAAFYTDEDGNILIDPDKESYYVVTRGGCWKCDPWSSQVTTRNPTRPDFASDFFGMRVCWDPQVAPR